MTDQDEVKVGDIVEVIISKPLTGKSADALKAQGYAKPNRLGQRAKVSALQQTNKAGEVIWTTKKDGNILIKYMAYDHPDGYSLPDQPPGKPPSLNQGQWKIVKTALVPPGAERARNEGGEYEPDDPTTDDKNEAYKPSSTETKLKDEVAVKEELVIDPPQGNDGSKKKSKSVKETAVEIKSGDEVFISEVFDSDVPNSMDTVRNVFNVQKAGWTPIVNTRSIDVKKLKEQEGSFTKIITEAGFKIRVLFSPATNDVGFNDIDTQEKYDTMLTNNNNMILREYQIGANLANSDISGTGNKSESIGMNISSINGAGESVNGKYPATAQVVSIKLNFNEIGQVESFMVDLIDRAGGGNEDYHPTHTYQSPTYVAAASSGSVGFGAIEDSQGTLDFEPTMTEFNRFYNNENKSMPLNRYVVGIHADLDNSVLRDLWLPMDVNWSGQKKIEANVVDGKNIGGYIKLQLSCQEGDTTDLIPGRWEDFTTDSPRQQWNNYPRSAVIILPHADDTHMSILSDDGERMGAIQEVKYAEVGGAIAQIQLISNFERDKTDENGMVVLPLSPDDDDYDPFAEPLKETVKLVRTIEKGQEVSFDVETRKGVGLQGKQTLKGEVTLFTAYPTADCYLAWEKRKGQRFSFLSLGQQTLTYIRHTSSNDKIDRYYIIVSNKPGEPHTGQVIVVDKSQPDAEDPASTESEDVIEVESE